MAKIKLIRVSLAGTGISETLLVKSHQILAYPASTYHEFIFPNGVRCLKNDFGVSSLVFVPVEFSQEELNKELGQESY